ncbi:MAG: glucan biosynthesis protein D [Stagnimonas sp.]|nr:glucan biosynthesis protein D [Stagnimonas sp.]
MNRRDFLQTAAALSAFGFPFLSFAEAPPAAAAATRPFDYAWLKGHAQALAAKPYVSHAGELPSALKNLSWDDYQRLQFKPEHSLWRDGSSPFQARLFHLGLYFQTPVQIYEVVNGQATKIAYQADHFKYDGKTDLSSLPSDLGYAGFRIQVPPKFELDVAAFLGASYFRAVGEDKQYGLSARGLAINTGLPKPEEFPIFSSYWLERPEKDSERLRVYALLDSPSTTGAYLFHITPGKNLVMEIDAALYPRKPIERLGLAPLTSMYQVGENDRRMDWDWRAEIHDSDGLAMHTGAGEWLWRPLMNPAGLRFNSYFDNNPRGFGLLQRDRNFDHYQDDGVFYEKRPSLWVEPKGDWGKGAVQLVEIPTVDETFDNIVAFWNPSEPVVPGKEFLFSYKLHWGAAPPSVPLAATVHDTRTGLGGVIGKKRTRFSWRFAVDFAGGKLASLDPKLPVEAVITTSRGEIEITSARPLTSINGYRAMFDLVPDKSTEPINLRLYLKSGNDVLSETWLYQYTPPPMSERKLY